MAANIGTIKSGTYAGPGGGTTVSITGVTQDAGSGRYLYLAIQHDQTYTPTVTYAGSAMTKILTYNGQGIYTDIFELANPTEGSNTIVLTYQAFVEYTANIGYMVLSCTGASGYGNTTTVNGIAVSPGLTCNLSSVGSGSSVFLLGVLPNSINWQQTLTIDGTSTTSPTYNQAIPSSARGTGYFKNNVTTGNCNLLSQFGYSMVGIAVEVKSGVTTVIPTVTTTLPTATGETTATGGGNVTADGGATVTARGVCWSTSPNPTTANSKTVDGSGTGTFTSNITGLTSGTLYYVRAYATNSVGTAYGNNITVVSLSVPTVTTSAITSIARTTATGGGICDYDTNNGGNVITARGVCWNTSTNPTTANSKTSDGPGSGTFASSITGILPNTLYYVRAYATNIAGTSYGSNVTFETLSATRRRIIII